MATYAIGDVQGCFDPLRRLLDTVGFDPCQDRLWFAGDLVNRGPDSLEVLRFVRALGERAVTVLGNHDLHLLAVAEGVRKPTRKDSLSATLEAPDRETLINWIRTWPLVHREAAHPHVMVHAGIPPQWDITDALRLAHEVELTLRGPDYSGFLHHMYGNFPDAWDESITGFERLRLITNYLTRMRFCSPEGRLDLDNKGGPADANPGFAPWFTHAARRSTSIPVIFGHWAALEGAPGIAGVHALDTGCVWGGRLRALCLDDGRLIHCDC